MTFFLGAVLAATFLVIFLVANFFAAVTFLVLLAFDLLLVVNLDLLSVFAFAIKRNVKI
jgi:hypothetical protein